MSIHDLAVRWAAGLARELGSDQKQENRMAFGLELLLGEIIKWIVLLGLAGILGLLREVVIICAAAGILRLASGGEHCNEYYRCLIGGTIWFLLLGWGVSWLNTLLTGDNLIIIVGAVFALSAFLLLLYAPGDTANKPISDGNERRKFKRLSLLVALCYLGVMLGTAQFTATQFITLTIAAGMLAQVFTVTPLGYGFLHWVDRVLTFD
ncbi:MAG: accessory gene regulator ArgB-like protein [Syntrophomonadaceae bacterium]|jgi:accessory gene regulator B